MKLRHDLLVELECHRCRKTTTADPFDQREVAEQWATVVLDPVTPWSMPGRRRRRVDVCGDCLTADELAALEHFRALIEHDPDADETQTKGARP
jgi:hypothetical protein